MRLRELAHSRTGDKGNTSNISLVLFDPRHFAHVREHVSADSVKHHFRDIVQGSVIRYELPALGAFNYVMKLALGGGVTRSLAMDAHGKSLSSALLDLEIPDPPS